MEWKIWFHKYRGPPNQREDDFQNGINTASIVSNDNAFSLE